MFLKINYLVIFIVSVFILTSCNSDVEDTSELWAKSQSSGDIIERSGSLMSTGSPEKRRLALQDAENRLRTGGGLLGKQGLDLINTDKNKNENQVTSLGMPINPYLWKGSLETIDFIPILSADPFAGIIITDWYTSMSNINERCKINIFIKGPEMKTSNLKVNSFCQIKIDSDWVDQEINKSNNAKLENAILNKAKKLRLSQS